jgi:hypothetical protein
MYRELMLVSGCPRYVLVIYIRHVIVLSDANCKYSSTALLVPASPFPSSSRQVLLHMRNMAGEDYDDSGGPSGTSNSNSGMGAGSSPPFIPQLNSSFINPAFFNPFNSMPVNPFGMGMGVGLQMGQMNAQMNNPQPNHMYEFQGSSQQSSNDKARKPKDSWNSKCRRCNRFGHRYTDCMMPSPQGFLTGCPRCETINHNYDDCRNSKRENYDDWKFIYLTRMGRPPLWTRTDPRSVTAASGQRTIWTQNQTLEEQHHGRNVTDVTEGEEHDERVAYAPWTASFARANSEVWQTYQYTNGVEGSELKIADPAWDDPDSIKDAELFNTHPPETPMLRNSRPAATRSHGPPNPTYHAALVPGYTSTSVAPYSQDHNPSTNVLQFTSSIVHQVIESGMESQRLLVEQSNHHATILAKQSKESSIAMSKQATEHTNALAKQSNSVVDGLISLLGAKRKWQVYEESEAKAAAETVDTKPDDGTTKVEPAAESAPPPPKKKKGRRSKVVKIGNHTFGLPDSEGEDDPSKKALKRVWGRMTTTRLL